MDRFARVVLTAALCLLLPELDLLQRAFADTAASGAGSPAAGGGTARDADIDPLATCALCAAEPPAALVPLTAAFIDSLVSSFATPNEARIAAIDSLYGAPPPDSRQAHDAQLLARLSTLNCYRLLARLATDSTCVHVADEQLLRDVFRDYSDVGPICIARLRELRLGLGHACLRYDLGQKMEGRTAMGGKVMRFRVKDADIFGRRRRVLGLDLPTGASDTVEILLADHYTFDVDIDRGDGPPGPYEAFIVDHIRGGWLRKWGTHRPLGFMFWASPGGTDMAAMPEVPLVGVRIYVPHLRLELPFLPDIDFDDLREMDLPQPILDMRYLREARFPSWLQTDEILGFKNWGGYGEVPAALRRRFPNY